MFNTERVNILRKAILTIRVINISALTNSKLPEIKVNEYLFLKLFSKLEIVKFEILLTLFHIQQIGAIINKLTAQLAIVKHKNTIV
ncbi:hypothetical protein [Mycoplasma sp. 4044]